MGLSKEAQEYLRKQGLGIDETDPEAGYYAMVRDSTGKMDMVIQGTWDLRDLIAGSFAIISCAVSEYTKTFLRKENIEEIDDIIDIAARVIANVLHKEIEAKTTQIFGIKEDEGGPADDDDDGEGYRPIYGEGWRNM